MSDSHDSRLSGHYRRPELDPRYATPAAQRPSADQERVLANQIRTGEAALERLTDAFLPWLRAVFQTIDASPFTTDTLFTPAKEGLRLAIERHALAAEPDGHLEAVTADFVRAQVASYIDHSTGDVSLTIDGGRWVLDRIAPNAFAEVVGNGPVTDPSLWRAVRERTDAIDTLVASYSGLVRSLVASRHGCGLPDEDLMQTGMVALRRAAASYSADRGASFATFARTTVHNELTNVYRGLSGCSANACRLIAEFQKEEMAIARASSGTPSQEEVFDRLLWSRTKRANYLKAVAASGQRSLENSGEYFDFDGDPLARLIAREDTRALHGWLDSLAGTDKEIVTAKYFAVERPSLVVLAARIGMSPDALGRRERELLDDLRRLLG